MDDIDDHIDEVPIIGHDGSINPPTDEQDSNQTQQQSSFTNYQKLTFIAMCCTYLSSMMSFSIIAPFFPTEAEKKDVSHSQIGFIFSVYNLVCFFASPLWGKLIPVIGTKFTFLAGCWVAGGCNVIFGFLDQLESGTQFLVFCYVVRSLEAVGAAASITAAMAIVANAFPDNVAVVMGWLEVFSGLGFAVGPPLGGALYQLGGYKLPFIVQGGIVILILVVNIFLLPGQDSNSSKEMGSFRALFRIPAVWPLSFAILVGSAALSFLDPTLSLHLQQFNLSPTVIGAVFLLVGGCYAIFSPVWGYLADKKRILRLMIVLGFHAAGVAYLLMGPSSVLKLPNELWIICMGLGLLGISIGCGLVPIFLDLLSTAFWYGMPDNLATQSIVSGLFNGMFSLGAFMGPFAGGVLTERYGFPVAASYFACANISVVFVIGLFGVWEYQCGYGRRKPRVKEETLKDDPNERSPLITEAPSWE
ncbi:MFS-type transporter SLC18B1-like [Amphiura filiformis]|uniref:MFS-type transporter SLC18B1-like n=1 Tax=Amphiura filiformis TaxID=82378 RepID=UPI003B20CE96